ncbi:MAG: acetate--CoA ligase family protein [Nanoarchaeota archaeon]|nr:acetate--CoA ligase family protein [Nanoarchaeota archaeon]
MLLNLENSFKELGNLPIAKYFVLPINADIENFKTQIEKIKFPCWIKLNSSEHKLSLGGVEKCNDFEDLKITHKKFKKKFNGSKFVIQEDEQGFEIIAGIKQDKTFGKVLMLGIGGILTEVIKDIIFRVCPLDKKEIFFALQELKIYEILKKQRYSFEKLVSLIHKFSELNIKEADINPLIINEKGIKIIDARLDI